MRAKITAYFLLVLTLLFYATGKAQLCVSVDAGADDTLCSGQCVTLNATVEGIRATTVYQPAQIPYQPYPFSGSNVVLANTDDTWSALINLPFCFEFYGTSYQQVVIGTNGLLSFDASVANGLCPWTIGVSAPDPALPMNCVMAPYHDLDPTVVTDSALTSINWEIYGTAPCRVFVASWYDAGMYGNGCSQLTNTSQIVLHETTNIIDIFIREKSVCPAWNNGAAIEGLHNATGTAASIYPGRNYPTPWTASNDGVRFSPAGIPTYLFQWLDPSGNVITTNFSTPQLCPTQTTTYTASLVNTGCSGNPIPLSDQVTIYVIPSTLSTTDSSVAPLCAGGCTGTIDIFASGGVPPYTYVWTPAISAGPSAVNLCAGSYICTVYDAAGCWNVIIVNLTPPPTFTMIPGSTPTGCGSSNGSASVNVIGTSGPYTYLWTTGDTTSAISGLAAGNYLVTVTDVNGCTNSITVTVNSVGLILSNQVTPLVCAGDCNASVTVSPLSGTPPYTYSWLPSGGNGPTESGLCSGNYICTVTDSTGCIAVQPLTITAPPPVIVTPNSNMTICQGQSTIIIANVTGGTPPYTYQWNNGLLPVSTNTITPTQTTVYTVIATDSAGCSSAIQSTMVKVNPLPVPMFSATTADCPPDEIYFTNMTDSAVTYLWNFGDPASGGADTSALIHPTHIYNAGGNYSVTLIATNSWGCTDSITLPNVISVPMPPDAALTVSTQVITDFDPPLQFNNFTTGAVSYILYFGDGDSLVTSDTGPYNHLYDSTGTYLVMLVAFAVNGCTDTTYLTFIVEEASSCFIPNAFTPNGNGPNNEFYVYGTNIHDMQLLIFDRWGELIFTSNDLSKGWNGTYKGSKCQEDVYVWKLRYQDVYGNIHERIGHVSLIR
ncbi:MAG: surface adhesion protein [Bacteroidetes bacterium]|nr:MAG: surface adhesion protein [Bacteroidota bacterium]